MTPAAPSPAAAPRLRICSSRRWPTAASNAAWPRAKAIRYAAQMLAGSAEMVLQSGKHPEQLKDEVCSPGGSTIAGVDALEQHGFRGSCIAAVDAAFEKTRQLG